MTKIEVIKKVIEKIIERRKVHESLAKLLDKLLHHMFPYAPKVEARTKAVGSIAGKILKKYIDLKDVDKIYDKLTDLVGARVIFLRKDQVANANNVIREIFDVDDYNSQDVGERLSDYEFGYQSKHYTIICDQNWLDKISMRGYVSLTDEIYAPLITFCKNNPKEKICVELQIRTWLQHVWADLSHDDIYKGDREIPHELRRYWSSIAAILEHTDESILTCLKQLEKYRTNGSYYIKKDLDKKIENLEIINEFLLPSYHKDDDFQQTWAAATLEKNHLELERLRNLQGNTRSDKTQKIWIAPVIDEKTLLSDLENDSTHPRILMYYLVEKENKECDIILKSLLIAAIERCDKMIASSLELPWAFAGKAFFLLYLNPNASAEINKDTAPIYDSVLRLIDLCNERSVANLGNEQIVATKDSRDALAKLKESMNVVATLKTISSVRDKDGFEVASLVECIQKLLSLSEYAYLMIEAEKPAETSTTSKPPQPPKPPVVIMAGGCDSLEGSKELDDFKEFFAKALQGMHSITFLTGGGDRGMCSLNFQQNTALQNTALRFGIPSDNNAQYTSLYGKHSLYEALMEWEYLRQLNYRFEDVALVGFGLGTISDFECRIALALGARVTIIRHKNFRSYNKTFGKIPYWSNHPSLIQLPVIKNMTPKNKSFESEVIKKKVIENGKEKEVTEKSNWQKDAEKYRDLAFPEPMMLRVFMLFNTFTYKDYKEKENDNLALLIHRIKRLKTMINPQDLKYLDPQKRLSEQHRLLFFETLYKDVSGLTEKITEKTEKVELHEDKNGVTRDDIIKWLEEIPDPQLLDYHFAEREHARWYIERWLQGTRYGTNKIEKDVPASQKRNPCMVAWYDLDDDTIIKDTEFLNRYIVAKAILPNQDLVDKISSCFPTE